MEYSNYKRHKANSVNLSSLVNILNQITVIIGMSAEVNYYFAFKMDIYFTE